LFISHKLNTLKNKNSFFIAGAAVAGGIFGLGAGALIGGYAAAVYWLIKCK